MPKIPRIHTRTLVATVGLAACAACAPTTDGSGSLAGRSSASVPGSPLAPGSSGSTGATGSTSAKVSLSLKWKAAVGGGIGDNQLSGGSADASRVYVGNDSGQVTALNADSGKVEWQVRPGSRSGTPVSNAAGVVFYYDSNNGLIALDAATGHTLWKGGQLGGDSIGASRPAYVSGLIALISESGLTDGIGGFDVRTGRRQWLVHQSNYIDEEVSPVATDGMIFGVRQPLDGNGAPNLMAIEPTTGKVVWVGALPGVKHDAEIELEPAGTDVVVVAGGDDENAPATVLGFDVASHARRWVTTVSGLETGGTMTPAYADGTLAFTTLKGVLGLTAATGKIAYTKQFDDGPAYATGVCQNHICGTGLSTLGVLDATGSVLGTYTAPSSSAATPDPTQISGGRTYLVNATYVYALG